MDYALKNRPADQVNTFGAAGVRTLFPSSETISSLSFDGPGTEPFFLPDFLNAKGENSISRMFSLPFGERASNLVGNEEKTLERCRTLSVEIIAEALLRDKRFPSELVQVTHGDLDNPPLFIVMNPGMEDVNETRVVTDELEIPTEELLEAAVRLADRVSYELHIVLMSFLSGGLDGLAQLFAICRPEVVMTRNPEMEDICLPDPSLKITGKMPGTVGIVCEDNQGVIGVTTAWHVAGNTGDVVDVDGHNEIVGPVSQVQDIAFIPINGNRPNTVSRLVMKGYGPRHQGLLEFEGAVTGKESALLVTVSPGLLSRDPLNRLTLRTEMKANAGDSGCALLEGNEVVGFALRNTKPGQYPEFTEWIWADNALAALNLSPL
ncbi:hypothetical protein [uncultured Ruegeria sp.]|uniref:hypothetical protein n=1 Tax=uncultured Ruegeria sp. TaxID=259304 RepID=UPI002627FBEE|nr:hypothetical protein [uncultured Ruegeria sp.]